MRAEISPELYIEDTVFEDIDRVMITVKGKHNPIYICAFPKKGVREQFDPGYQSIKGIPFPDMSEMKSKVKVKLDNILNDLELYD